MQGTGHLVSLWRRYDLFSLSCVEEAGLKFRLFCCTGLRLIGLLLSVLAYSGAKKEVYAGPEQDRQEARGRIKPESNLTLTKPARHAGFPVLAARLAQQPVFALSSSDEISPFWPH
jgi:hypothetical protein